MNKVRNFAIMLGTLFLFIIIFLVLSVTTKKPQKAYDFAAGTHTGEVINLYDNLGKTPTALMFFDPEIEGSNTVLSKLIAKKDGFDIVAISVSALPEQKQKELLPENWDTVSHLCFEGSEAIEKYNIGNAPITYFIDKDGYIIDAYVGNIKETSIEKLIKKLA